MSDPVEVLLKDIRMDDGETPVLSWPFVPVPETTDVRIYYKVRQYDTPGKAGFDFCAVRVTCYEEVPNSKETVGQWNPDKAYGEVEFSGSALFDGIRHLYLGSNQTDNFGYLYYPKIKTLQAELDALLELEKQYCDAG